jgi:hypothetical protein
MAYSTAKYSGGHMRYARLRAFRSSGFTITKVR